MPGKKQKIITVFFIMLLGILTPDSVFSQKPEYRKLPDGVEHWYRTKQEKPWFFQQFETVFKELIPDENELPFGKSVAFLVGVSDYTTLPKLSFVKNDLTALREYLLDNGGFDEVYVAADKVATPTLVDNYMRNNRMNLRKKDRLLFYYSGHGADRHGQTGYMQFADATGEYSRENYMRIDECLEWSRQQSSPSHILFIFDCCASGLAFAEKSGSDDVPYNRILAALSGKNSRTVITAGTAGQATYGVDKHSVFTKAFLNALRRAEHSYGFMTISQIYDQIRVEISEFSQKHAKITPQKWELEKDVDSGTFLFIDTSAKNVKLPEEYKKTMDIQPTPKGQTIASYGIIHLISYVSGEVYVDGQKVGDIKSGEGMKIPDQPVRETPATVEVRAGKQSCIRQITIEKGKPVVVRCESEPEPSEEVTTPVKTPVTPPPPGDKTFTNSLGMKFVKIPAGTFTMGSPSDEPGRYSDETQHEVTISKPFFMQTTEVTQGQWKAVMGNNPSNFKDCGDNCPVESVSWDDIQGFIKKLNQKGEGTYRLPTEAEWEYAARAGTATPFSFGKCLSTDQANYDGNYPLEGCPKGKYREKTVPVGSFAPNAWGLYDMHGNVWEWCADWKGDYPSGAVSDPTGPSSGSNRVLRGGSWYRNARYCRTAYRDSYSPGSGNNYYGFRLVHP